MLTIHHLGKSQPGRIIWRSDELHLPCALNRYKRDAAYLAGTEFTAADIMIVFTLTTMRIFMLLDLGPYPHLKSYLRRRNATSRSRFPPQLDVMPTKTTGGPKSPTTDRLSNKHVGLRLHQLLVDRLKVKPAYVFAADMLAAIAGSLGRHQFGWDARGVDHQLLLATTF
jgi:hypothetical protein